MVDALSGITRRTLTAWKSVRDFARTLRKGLAIGRASTIDHSANPDPRISLETTISLEESKSFLSMERSFGYDAESAVNYPAGMTRKESLRRLPEPPLIVLPVPNTMPTVPERDDEDSPLAV